MSVSCPGSSALVPWFRRRRPRRHDQRPAATSRVRHNSPMPTPRARTVLVSLAAAAVVLALLAVLVARGVLWPNRLLAARYDVRGVDVSAYQGRIDWPTLAAQDVD